MQAQHSWHEEHQWIQVCNTPMHAMPAQLLNVAALSGYDSNVGSSTHVEMSESEKEIWPDHPKVVDDYAHDCDSVGPNVVELNPDPSSHCFRGKLLQSLL